MSNLRSELYSAFYDTDPAPIVEFMQWLATSYNVSNPPRILDIGCGPGRMLREFAQLGWQPTGMEPDPDYFAQASKVAEAFKNVTLQAGGFADINTIEEFDIVTAINGPFYYMLRLEERIDALRRIFLALKPGGILFLDMANFLWIINNLRKETHSTATVNGQVVNLVVRPSIDFHDCIFTVVDEFSWNNPLEGEEKVTETSKFAIIPLPELLYFVEKQGFKNIQTYNSYKSRENERLAGSRLMLSAQKPN
jgi:SAM-dependent methyltransferase